MADPGHPPPPWRLRGELLLIPAGPGTGLMLARYTGGTLAYHELIVFGRPFVVSEIYVDDARSRAGGREIWNLPKELAEFRVSPRRFEVRRAGELLLAARIRRRPGRLPLVIPTPAVGELDGRPALAVGRARLRAAPALVTLEGRYLTGTRLGLAGDALDLTMPAPLRRSAAGRGSAAGGRAPVPRVR
jgi:acetoacetate decarboxylase